MQVPTIHDSRFTIHDSRAPSRFCFCFCLSPLSSFRPPAPPPPQPRRWPHADAARGRRCRARPKRWHAGASQTGLIHLFGCRRSVDFRPAGPGWRTVGPAGRAADTLPFDMRAEDYTPLTVCRTLPFPTSPSPTTPQQPSNWSEPSVKLPPNVPGPGRGREDRAGRVPHRADQVCGSGGPDSAADL